MVISDSSVIGANEFSRFIEFTVFFRASSLSVIVSSPVFSREIPVEATLLLIFALSPRFPRLLAPLEAILSIPGNKSFVVSMASDEDSVRSLNVFII